MSDDYFSGYNDSRIPGISSIARIYGIHENTLYARITAQMNEKLRSQQ